MRPGALALAFRWPVGQWVRPANGTPAAEEWIRGYRLLVVVVGRMTLAGPVAFVVTTTIYAVRRVFDGV